MIATNDAQNLVFRHQGFGVSAFPSSRGDSVENHHQAQRVHQDDDERARLERHHRTQQTRPRSSSSDLGFVTKLTPRSVTDATANDQNAVQRYS